ncbi:nucleoside-diphosphate-sugar epimerase [Athelia psychrophila]|uniref:Nucleoside-diphosphate-sugar epimerase n=1 Tax=Athelia psychrophila TaxID=1759441 RepID=A0A166QQ42_9AGAM|nr:nucleoside-diphosphate-sugar epimerase [Fibularhizoctonia sp. CBS 109695]
MSQQKIFITGASGYIGGSVLHGLTQAFKADRVEITALVRNEEKAAKITAAHPDVKIAIGDFDSVDVIEKAAEESNIVIHTVSDNLVAINAILAGLNRRAAPSFLIHTSGTALVADVEPSSYGEAPTKTWSDITDMPEISTFPEEGHLHRHVDKLILPLSAATNNKIRTAIVCPPDIYGRGTGTGNNQSILIPLYAELIGADPGAGAFVVGAGKNIKSFSHIRDVVDVFLLLASEALQPGGGKADWGSDGFYFTATSTVSFPELAEKFVAVAKERGWLPPTTPDAVQHRSVEDMKPLFNGLGAYMWGANAVTSSDRAKKVFGWTGNAPSWQECLEEDVKAAFGAARTDSLKWLTG